MKYSILFAIIAGLLGLSACEKTTVTRPRRCPDRKAPPARKARQESPANRAPLSSRRLQVRRAPRLRPPPQSQSQRTPRRSNAAQSTLLYTTAPARKWAGVATYAFTRNGSAHGYPSFVYFWWHAMQLNFELNITVGAAIGSVAG